MCNDLSVGKYYQTCLKRSNHSKAAPSDIVLGLTQQRYYWREVRLIGLEMVHVIVAWNSTRQGRINIFCQ
jgi:hypothetical protein